MGVAPTIEIKKTVIDSKKPAKNSDTKDRLDKFK